jgi:hypothetical protein
MRSPALGLIALIAATGLAAAEDQQSPPAGAPPAAVEAPADQGEKKKNANPCRDEVAEALGKLRKSSWFHMATNMITENGPTTMEVDYVLPDKMRQKVTQTLTQQSSEVILSGEKAWGNQGTGWQELPSDITQTLKAQMYDNVVAEQTDVGEYACKGKVQLEGRDALSYKLEQEQVKDSTAPKSATFRMFYVDATTGLPLSNALMVPGREKSPIFKATYTFPLDIKIEPPKDVVAAPPPEKK